MKFLRAASLFVGIAMVLAITLSLIALILRALYVEVRGPVVLEQRLSAKLAYLEQVEPGAEERFNIVLIFFDDLGWGDLSSYGNAFISTPNIDVLPTVLDLLKISQPADRIIDGKSIAPTLFDGRPSHEVLYYFPTVNTLPGAVRDRNFKLTRATGDPGRDREHLSRIAGTEAHEVSNLYPEAFTHLKSRLSEKRDEIASNPRGWRPFSDGH